MTEEKISRIICESCGEKFSCGAKSGECRCFKIEIKAETLIKLRETFANCLCENCLRKIEASETRI